MLYVLAHDTTARQNVPVVLVPVSMAGEPAAISVVGDGRQNSHTLVDGWFGGIGPRLGLAYALNNKTTIRTAFGRSFKRVTVTRDSDTISDS